MSLSWTEITRLAGTQLRAVTPPYRALTSLDCRGHPPLGAVVFAYGSNALAALAALTSAVHQWPWVVPCVAIHQEQGPLEPLLFMVSELRNSLGVVKEVRNISVGGDVAAIVAAVRRRKAPDAGALTEWIERRIGATDLSKALAHQFEEALGGLPASESVSSATYCRLFMRFGPYTARDWRAIARLCAHVASNGPFQVKSLLTGRAAHQHVKKYVGARVVPGTLGWEWVLEGALRAGRYVSASS